MFIIFLINILNVLFSFDKNLMKTDLKIQSPKLNNEKKQETKEIKEVRKVCN